MEMPMDDLDALRSDPIGWIISNIKDDLTGIEWVLDEMDADDILDPALEAYIVPEFARAGIAVPDRSVLIDSINQLMKRML